MYEKGIGTLKDTAKRGAALSQRRRAWLCRSAEFDGHLYATGTSGVAQDEKQALDWYQKAADQGFAKAQKNLGDMYFFGHGVDKDYKQA